MSDDKPSRYPPTDPAAREFLVHPDMVGRFARRGDAMLADNATVVGDVRLGKDVADHGLNPKPVEDTEAGLGANEGFDGHASRRERANDMPSNEPCSSCHQYPFQGVLLQAV